MDRRWTICMCMSLAALIVATVSIFMVAGLYMADRREDVAAKAAMAAAQANADRIRSSSQARGMVHGILAYAINGNGEAPPEDTWRQILIDEAYIQPSAFHVRGGNDVPVPYHYVRPTAEQIAEVNRGGGGDIIVIYEDPDLWDDGGNVIYLNTGAEWIDGAAYARYLEEALGR